MGARVVSGVIAMITAVAAVSVYTFWRVERVQANVELVNQFYVPLLKHLNLLSGKWSAYQRSYEQAVGFRRWGTKGFEPNAPKLYLRKMVEGNLAEMGRIVERVRPAREVPERARLETWLNDLGALAEREQARVVEIAGLVKAKHYGDAAAQYGRARQEHLNISQGLITLNREVEGRVALLQLATEEELRNSQGVMLVLLGISLLFSVVVLFRLRRWLLPIVAWTRVAQEIALKGVHSLGREIRFPQVTRSMPPEIALLTREFTRMGMTVLERERTIQSQKEKLESLNGHLKDQNVTLRKLGGLNERVLNSMSSGLLVIGADGRVEQFNDKYCELFGVARGRVLGLEARELLVAWPKELVSAWLNSDEPLHFTRLERGNRVFDVRVQQLPAQGGHLIVFEDVTELVEAEKKVEHARRLVLAGDLSAQVAHEVRNPLNSMSLQLELLEEDVAETVAEDKRAAVAARVGAVAEQVQRLERITRRYLDVKRTGATVARDAVDLHGVIEKCLAFLSGELQAARIRVELDFKAPDAVVGGDADALSQVVFNLVRNAIDALRATADAGRVLTIRTWLENGRVAVSVRDTGPGVSAAVRSRLFEPFVTDKAAGHGLGLSVSRQICIEHGGELRLLESEGGAEFEFMIASKEGGVDAPNPGC